MYKRSITLFLKVLITLHINIWTHVSWRSFFVYTLSNCYLGLVQLPVESTTSSLRVLNQYHWNKHIYLLNLVRFWATNNISKVRNCVWEKEIYHGAFLKYLLSITAVLVWIHIIYFMKKTSGKKTLFQSYYLK